MVSVVCANCRGTAVGETNVQGEDQKKLDVIANELFINMLKSSFEVGVVCLFIVCLFWLTVYCRPLLI